MSKAAIAEKEKLVNAFAEELKSAKAILVINYLGLTILLLAQLLLSTLITLTTLLNLLVLFLNTKTILMLLKSRVVCLKAS